VQPLPPYRGDEPYVFVSYSHEDDVVVFKEIRWLQDNGVNVWFDEGISPGSEWSEALARGIEGCAHFLYFITPRSVASENCRRELNHALADKRRVLAVHLKDTDVPGGIRLSLDNRQAILKHKLDQTAYRRTLLEALGSAQENDKPSPASRASRASQRRLTRAWIAAFFAALAIVGSISWWRTTNDPAKVNDSRIRFEAVAVLPFSDLSVDQDLGALANRVTHQLITRLDELPALEVASLTAVEPLLQQDLPLAETAQRLDTPLVLKGYLQRDGDHIEVPVELVRAADGRVLWSTTLSRVDDDRALVSRFVVGELFEFIGSVKYHPSPGPDSIEAYRAWLNWHYHKASVRNWDEVKWIELVLQMEPSFAWGQLDAFDSYFVAAYDGQGDPWIERAKSALDAARRAGLADEPRYRSSMGRYLTYIVGDLDRGEKLLRDSGDFRYLGLLSDSGIPEPGVRFFERATSQQPFRTGTWLGLGFARGMAGDLPGALEAYEQGLKRMPDHPYLVLQQCRALIFLGNYDEAERSLARLMSLEPLPAGSNLAIRSLSALLDGRQGKTSAALQAAAQLAEDSWFNAAGVIYLDLGDPRAKDQFELAAAHPVPRVRFVSSWLNADPGLADHPIVKPYLKSLGYTPAWRQEICTRAVSYAAELGVHLTCDAVSDSL
jgi:TolB-like protein